MATHLIEVAFKGNRKDFFLWEGDEAPPLEAAIIVDADRGEDLGHVHATGDAADKRNAGASHGYGQSRPEQKARRLATTDDERRWRELRDQDEDARRKAMDRVKANQLVMKLSDAEWQWDRKKLTIYFTADKRVDFRNLVRELAAMFRTRIELKQIGVRDEAKRLDGIGRCGRQYCSSSWLPELRPVNLGVAKDQKLSLNPSQISGACGRLMCCLRYEHEFYVEQRRRFPKEGKVLVTSRGEEKVVANDIFRERVTLRSVENEIRVIPLEELRAEMERAGAPLPAQEEVAIALPGEDDEDVALGAEGASASPVTSSYAGSYTSSRVGPKTSSYDTPADEASGAGVPDEGQKKPHRRRGRRGGRRNRPGRRPDGSAPNDGNIPPASSPGGGQERNN